ncbi:hypothetical protein AMTR_s00191p00042090 [Amborella trichopoda]|uniref:Uncharacterized protein n=1 Tax=Amborella trichopoda TaxID=13333 RepID=W1PWB8_AMBTC|nr:hypothetical protein AMTR_s00191p00042090 [Amborella trichopoda]
MARASGACPKAPYTSFWPSDVTAGPGFLKVYDALTPNLLCSVLLVLNWGGVWGGGDESLRHRAESQWIVAARPLCHLQHPVAYLSRLQRILPTAQWELHCKAVPHRASTVGGFTPGVHECSPTVGRQTDRGDRRRFLAWILT